MTDFEQEFDAALEDDPRTGDVFVVAPFSVADTYGTKGTLPVHTAIGDGYHALVIPREVRRAVGKTLGDVLHVALSHDLEERVVDLPEDLAAALAENPAAQVFFKSLEKPDQRAYVRYLKGAKTPEARAKRLTETVYRLSVGRKRETGSK